MYKPLEPAPSLAVLPGEVAVSEQGADRRIHLGKAFLLGIFARAEGVVAAGVENDQIQRFGCTRETADERIELEALLLHVGRRFDIGIDVQQIILPGQLDAMAGVMEQPHTFASGERIHIGADRACHRRPVRFEPDGYIEPQSDQAFADGAGVLDRVLQSRIDGSCRCR